MKKNTRFASDRHEKYTEQTAVTANDLLPPIMSHYALLFSSNTQGKHNMSLNSDRRVVGDYTHFHTASYFQLNTFFFRIQAHVQRP